MSGRYEIKYYKLSAKKKKKCDKYKNAIKQCNSYYKKIKQNAIAAGIEMSASVLLQKVKNPELAEAYRDSYNKYLSKVGENIFLWRESFKPIKDLYNKIKKYGKKY